MELFLAFVLALSVTAVLIPVLERWAPTVGLNDRPGPRKLHSAPVPRVGGLAMAAGILVATGLTLHLTAPVRGVLLGVLVLLGFGIWDDWADLGYQTKFAGQIIAVGLCMTVGGVHVGTFMLGGLQVLPPVISALITFVFLIGVTNAVKFADGLDGLAGGLVLLCLCAIALFAVAGGSINVTGLALIVAGAVLGFLRYNTQPARIFMGDSGSQMLGFCVGTLALLATQGESSPVSAALPLLLLGLPIMDTLTVMLTRIRAGRSPFVADRNHLYHRLLALGFAHREAVVIIYLAQVVLVLLAYFLRFESDLAVLTAFCVFAGTVLALLHWASQSGWRVEQVHLTGLRRYLNGTGLATRVPSLALGVMAACLALYAAMVLAASHRVGIDLGMMSLVLLIVLLALSSWRAERSLVWFERAAAYISVVLLVYLDQTCPNRPPLLATLSWITIGVTGVAALARFWFSPTRRFELTTLDLIVIFISLVLPNLPGSIPLPPDLPGGIAKSIILLYVVEMLLTVDLKHRMPRVFLGVTLAVIAGRALIGVGA